MPDLDLSGRLVLVTGGARRIGRSICLACARAGADIVLHYNHAAAEARAAAQEIESLGRQCWLVQADFRNAAEVDGVLGRPSTDRPFFAIVNNAAVFDALDFDATTPEDWHRTLAVNLTAPFLLAKQFAGQVPPSGEGRILNLLDWRALRPGADHFPYTLSKAALADLTKSLALVLAPRISVNGIALGAILPPADGSTPAGALVSRIPAGRWGDLHDVEQAVLFLLAGPRYVTGEIIHVDGGRHLT